MRILTKVLFTGTSLLGVISASALQYDQNVNLNGPAAPAGNAPGIYYGSGNANGGWTVDRSNNIELGLRAHVRYPSPQNVYNSSGNGVYSFTDNSSIAEPATQASWNYDFSINVREGGSASSSAVLNNFTFTLAIDSDPGLGQAWTTTFNPRLILDNAPFFSSTIAQNSENPGFLGVGIPFYNKNIAGSYDFLLSAYNGQGALVAQTSMRVNVNGGAASVPDGGSTGLLSAIGLGTMLSLNYIRRKKIAA